jgi:triacylglycerol esterase/lipase EstA (alpha/beta hydrolase family)
VKLKAAHEASGGRKVNIISHSMGGMLVLCFMSLHNDVRKFILLISCFMGHMQKVINSCATRGMTSDLTFCLQVFSKYVNKWICIACPFQGNLLYRKSTKIASNH